MIVGKPERHYQMTHRDIECRIDHSRDMELFECHFATFLYFGFIFSVLRVFKLDGRACAAGLELDLHAENPFPAAELVVARQDKTRNRNSVAVQAAVSVGRTEAVDAIVLERA